MERSARQYRVAAQLHPYKSAKKNGEHVRIAWSQCRNGQHGFSCPFLSLSLPAVKKYPCVVATRQWRPLSQTPGGTCVPYVWHIPMFISSAAQRPSGGGYLEIRRLRAQRKPVGHSPTIGGRRCVGLRLQTNALQACGLPPCDPEPLRTIHSSAGTTGTLPSRPRHTVQRTHILPNCHSSSVVVDTQAGPSSLPQRASPVSLHQ